MAMPNTKARKDRIDAANASIDTKLAEIKATYKNSGFGFNTVAESGFNKTNVLKDLSNNVKGMAIPEEETMPSLGIVNGYNTVNAFLLKGYTKNGIVYADPQNPSEPYTETRSNTLMTDRADGNLNINRWTSRNIFKFTSEQYGYDRCVFIIPLADLANGVVIDGGEDTPHGNTLKHYPYPEEIIMTSQKTEENFIHFINVQYTDAHCGHFNGRNYNLMIVKDRTRYGVLNDTGDGFKDYTSVYANDTDIELAFVDNGYLYLPVPDSLYGEELLDTLWDCRVIWREDAPDRNIRVHVTASSSGITDEMHQDINDFYVLDDRIHFQSIDSTYILKTRLGIDTTDRAIVTSFINSNIHGDCVLSEQHGISIAPSFQTHYNPTQPDEHVWMSTGIPNRIFKISNDNYLGFYYCEINNHITRNDPLNNDSRSTQLYWGLFDSTMKRISPASSTDTHSIYPCNSYSENFNNRGKIIKVFRRDINQNTGISSYYVFTETGVYIFTFSLSDNIITNTSIEEIPTSITLQTGWRVERMNEDMFWFFGLNQDGEEIMVHVNINGTCLVELQNHHTMIGRTCSAYFEDGNIIPHNSFKVLDVGSTEYSAYISGMKNYDGRYGLTIGKDSTMVLYGLLEIFTFDKEFLAPPSYWITTTERSDTSRNWKSVCYGKDKFVAIAYTSNIFAYSIDGINWTEGTISPTNRNWTSVCYGDNKFIAVSSSKVFAYSTDGITWTEGTISSRSWTSVCYGDNKFIAVSSSKGFGYYTSDVFAYSTDGITWTEGTISSRSWTSVCYGDNKFVAISYRSYFEGGSDVFAYSTDGITWTEGTISSRSWRSVCYGNGKFVAVSELSSHFAYSTDGITWTDGTISKTDKYWSSVCYGNGKFVAVSELSTHFAYSTDGITWIEGTISEPFRYWKSICCGNDKFVAVASANSLAYSLSGIDWNIVPVNYIYGNWQSVCYGKDKFVAVDNYFGIYAYSIDGITWTLCTISPTIRNWQSVCYGKDKFVAVARESNVFAYSTDGITWTEGTISETNRNWYSVCYGDNKFIAVSSSKVFAYSTDGITWTEGTISSRSWKSVCYGNGKFVAIHDDDYGTFAYSTDGINWTLGTISDVSRYYRQSICYGDGKFVIVGWSKDIFEYSYDGISWIKGNMSSTNGYWNSVCYGNGKYVAVEYLPSGEYYATAFANLIEV